jgi:hypothetical protein
MPGLYSATGCFCAIQGLLMCIENQQMASIFCESDPLHSYALAQSLADGDAAIWDPSIAPRHFSKNDQNFWLHWRY